MRLFKNLKFILILKFLLYHCYFSTYFLIIGAYGLRDRNNLKTRSNQITTKSDYKQDDYEMTEEEQTKRAIEESLASYKLDNPDVIIRL